MPEGTLIDMWNLIVWACSACNSAKAQLEDDISAITMQPDAIGRYPSDDERLIADAIRKRVGSFSRRTGARVGDSIEHLTIGGDLAPGVTIDFNLSSPPQLDIDRAFLLARLQAMAFFYWLTFNDESRRGGFWPGEFMPINSAARGDWGNKLMRCFMETTRGWEPRVIAIGADRFYKIAIRRSPNTELWSLALEWNMNYRVTAAFGNVVALNAFAAALPRLEFMKFRDGWGRIEVELEGEEDTMFGCKLDA